MRDYWGWCYRVEIALLATAGGSLLRSRHQTDYKSVSDPTGSWQIGWVESWLPGDDVQLDQISPIWRLESPPEIDATWLSSSRWIINHLHFLQRKTLEICWQQITGFIQVYHRCYIKEGKIKRWIMCHESFSFPINNLGALRLRNLIRQMTINRPGCSFLQNLLQHFMNPSLSLHAADSMFDGPWLFSMLRSMSQSSQSSQLF